MVAIFETVENGKSIIKNLSNEMVVSIHEQVNDTEKKSITVSEYDEETDKIFSNIFFKKHIIKITMFNEE